MTTRKRMAPAERDWLGAAREGDRQAANYAMVEMQRDPERWFCSGFDEGGMPRVFGRGDTKAEVEANARAGAANHIAGKASFRIVAPTTGWRFISYEPD